MLENLRLAFDAIRANKMRSFLTMLGIIIGIGSVISIVSIGDTMRALVADQYKSVGENIALTYVMVDSDEDSRMTDMYTLDELDDMKAAFSEELQYISSRAYVDTEMIQGRNKMKTSLTGILDGYNEVQPTKMLYGRMINEMDVQSRRLAIVLEQATAQKLFGTDNVVGRTLRGTIRGDMQELTVVGVYKKEVSALDALNSFGTEPRGEAYVPQSLLTYPDDYFFMIEFYTVAGIDKEQFKTDFCAYQAKVKDRLPEQIYYTSAAEEMGMMDTIMGGLSVAVGAIAAISLLVGGIGIMNIMMVSVTERTREIGIRKALGAQTSDVLIQFLTESALLAAAGGIIGVIWGVGIVALGGLLLGLDTVIRPSVVIGAVLFSAMVGIFFGYYPASKAAKADPVVALRYE